MKKPQRDNPAPMFRVLTHHRKDMWSSRQSMKIQICLGLSLLVFCGAALDKGFDEKTIFKVDVHKTVTSAAPEKAGSLSGPALVSDGDTLKIGTQRIRLFGVDAFEKGQNCWRSDGTMWQCGKAGLEALLDFVGPQNVTCQARGTDSYGRLIATCSVSGQDIGRHMIDRGLAVAYIHYSDHYVSAELQARALGLGVHEGRFLVPWEYRKRQMR